MDAATYSHMTTKFTYRCCVNLNPGTSLSGGGQVQRLVRRGSPPSNMAGFVQSLGGASCSHVLIDEDRISIRIHSDETGRPRCALVRLLLQLHSLGL
jgi:hypothetical protein